MLGTSRHHLKVAEEGCASGGLVVGCSLRPQQLKRPPCRLPSASGVAGPPRLLSLPTGNRDMTRQGSSLQGSTLLRRPEKTLTWQEY